MYQRVTMNMGGAGKRYETLNGKQHLVVPTVMLTEGVHKGDQGPLYYPPQELGKNPVLWNHKPVVIYHPVMGSNAISACDPGVVERQGVGVLFNTIYDGRLRTEAWLDEDKLKRVDNRVLEAINNGQIVEVSTGLFHDPDMTPGKWGNEEFVGTVHNIQPDHLAILFDQKGACSVEDGAGLLRNASHDLSCEDVRGQMQALLKNHTNLGTGPLLGANSRYCYVCDVYPDYVVAECDDKTYKVSYKVKSGKVHLQGEPEEVRKVTSYVTANGATLHGVPVRNNEEHQGPLRLPQPHAGELSGVMQHQQMQKALTEHYSGITQEGDWGGWVTDLFANYVVYSKDGKQFRLPYTYDDDKIRFDGEPEEVERVSEYRTRRQTPIDGTSSPYNVNGTNMTQPTRNTIHQGAHELMHQATHHDAHHGPEPTPSGHATKSDSQVRTHAGEGRKGAVNKLISEHGWKEEDRSFLEGLPDDHFEKVSSYSAAGASRPIQPYSYEGIGDRSNAHGSGTNHAPSPANNRQMTANQYIESAPPEIRAFLQEGMAAHAAEKQRLVKCIVANRANKFSEQWLSQQPIDMLRGMASLSGMQAPVANFAGQAEVPMFIDNQQVNSQAIQDDVLPLPSMFTGD